MKILLAVDGSPFTKRMLAYLAAHDDWFGAHHQYTILTVAPPLPGHAASAINKDVIKAYHDEHAEEVFGPVRAVLDQQKIAATYVHKVGDPAGTIANQAVHGDFDLLVMGSHGHGNLVNLITGSVATRTMAQCKTPVLLIR